jgi:hypothetical protein
MATSPTDSYGGTVIRDLFRPWRTVATWHRLSFLCLDAWVGTLTFATLLPLVATALGLLVIFPAAVVIAFFTTLLVRAYSRLERSRVRSLLGVEIPPPEPTPQDLSLWKRFTRALRDRVQWTSLGYFLLLFPVGMVVTAITVGAWVGSAMLVALPLYVDELPRGVADLGLIEIGSGSAWIATLVGIGGLAVAAPWITTGLASARASLARALLAR